MKRSSKGSSEKGSNGDESPNSASESESPNRISQNETSNFHSDTSDQPIELIQSNEEQVNILYIKAYNLINNCSRAYRKILQSLLE